MYKIEHSYKVEKLYTYTNTYNTLSKGETKLFL